MTSIGEIVFQAVKNAHEHGIVKERSLRDSLTGLFNRRVLEEMLALEIGRRDQGPVALMVLDLDNFKRINDTYGHPAGDLVLSTFGAILRKCCRTTDIVARYGGEEFAVLVSGYSSEVALKIAERLRKTLAEHQFSFSGEKACITTSIGVAFREKGVDSSEELLSRADQALYKAKKNGKNQVSVFNTDSVNHVMPRVIPIRSEKKNPALATIAA